MSFSRKYPVSTYFYDPEVQPTKQIAQLQNTDEKMFSRQIPQGRYDTTYRREFLNFKNGVNTQNSGNMENYASSNYTPTQDNDKSDLNRFALLPPINSATRRANEMQNQNTNQFAASPSMNNQNNFQMPTQNPVGQSSDYLPTEPIRLSPKEEESLIEDVQREFRNSNSNQIKQFYQELLQYDPKLTGFVHYQHINMAAIKTNLSLNESLLRFVLSKFVSPNKERGYVNYEELVKFFGKCIENASQYGMNQYQQQNNQMPQMHQQQQNSQMAQMQQPNYNQFQENNNTTNNIADERYDPDEQAILRLMHENMREWDQINLFNNENLRMKFFEADPNQSYIFNQSQIEDVLYRNRIPIQRSLIYQILEKYCKISSGFYRWPAFVDFLEKLHHLRLPNKKKTDYTIRHDEKDNYSEKFVYRVRQLDCLKSKANEEERIQEINKQIDSLQNIKQDNQQRIGSSLATYVKGESWFTRFMRLANAIYTHRMSNGVDFVLPKEEARNLIKAYNKVFELNIPNNVLEDGLNNCQKGPTNVVIDDLLKFLSKPNPNMT